MNLFIVLCILFFCIIWIRHILHRWRDPPGPLGIPFVGILFQRSYLKARNKLYRNFHFNRDIGKAFGGITSYEVGLQRIVVLHSYEAIRKAMFENGQLFSGRPNTEFHKQLSQNAGVASIDGESWKMHRRFTLSSLRSFGLGKQSLEPAVITEAEFINELIMKDVGKPVNSFDFFVQGVTNIIAVLVFGERWGYEDPNFNQYVKYAHAVTHATGIKLFLTMCYPFISKTWISSYLSVFKDFLSEVQQLKKAISDKYIEHKIRFDPNEEPRDLIEAYLNQQQVEERSGNTQYFSDNMCKGDCFDLFIAGMDTTSTNLSWCMVMISVHPQVQKRLHREIDDVIGLEKSPQMADRKRMPYCQAVLDEVARFCTIAPQGVPRRVMENTVFMGYPISDSDLIFVDIYSIHHDEKLWENPNDFIPERFLNENGDYTPSEYLSHFGLGKRRCLGEGLAQMENFLMLTSIMQKFRVSLDSESMTRLNEIIIGTDGLVHSPGQHRTIFSARQ